MIYHSMVEKHLRDKREIKIPAKGKGECLSQDFPDMKDINQSTDFLLGMT